MPGLWELVKLAGSPEFEVTVWTTSSLLVHTTVLLTPMTTVIVSGL